MVQASSTRYHYLIWATAAACFLFRVLLCTVCDLNCAMPDIRFRNKNHHDRVCRSSSLIYILTATSTDSNKIISKWFEFDLKSHPLDRSQIFNKRHDTQKKNQATQHRPPSKRMQANKQKVIDPCISLNLRSKHDIFFTSHVTSFWHNHYNIFFFLCSPSIQLFFLFQLK